jgi:lipid II:glycine glycyltransferase (peptidoglycan interpeptide bridge formation enzyme)
VDKWAAVAAGMGESCRVWVARRDGHAIAAIVVLTYGDQAYYWRGAMDKERVTGTGANELLHCSALEDACAAGVRQYDLGVSPTEALARFKAGFGPRRERLVTYRFERVPVSHVETWVRDAAKRVAHVRAPEPTAPPETSQGSSHRRVSRA